MKERPFLGDGDLMAMFWPIFVVLIGFGIACYAFGSTRRGAYVRASLYTFAGVFLLMTGAMIQADGLMIDWPEETNQGETVDGNVMTQITYTTLSSSTGNEVWMISWGLIAMGLVPIFSALIVVGSSIWGGRREEEEF